MSKVFIIGAMGVIGSQLVSEYLEKTNCIIYAGIHKGRLEQDISIWLDSVGEQNGRIVVVPIELCETSLGLEDTLLQEVQSEVKEIIHTAATTRFDLPLSQAREINVEGTSHVLDLALNMSNLEKLALTSTVFVAGKRTGNILEEELEHNEGFVNTYEQSKYEMEQLGQTYFSQLPISIYRFSTIIGDSKLGKVHNFTAPHQAIRLMYLGLASMIPGRPNYVVDLIPSDVASSILFELFQEHFSPGETFQIVAGPDKSFELQELLDQTYELLGLYDVKWSKKNYPQPSITSSEAFNLFLTSAREANNPFVTSVLTAISHFAHQLDLPKTFSLQETKIRLPDYDQKMPHINGYYDKVIKYCLDTNWGRRP